MVTDFDIAAIVNDENRQYHRYLRQGELRLQRCSHCGHLRGVARRECPQCLSERCEWEEMSGRGRVETFIWYFEDVLDRRYTSAWAWRGDLPYNVAIVKLEEGPQFITNIEHTAFGQLTAGQAVTPVFVAISDDYGILRFTPATSV